MQDQKLMLLLNTNEPKINDYTIDKKMQCEVILITYDFGLDYIEVQKYISTFKMAGYETEELIIAYRSKSESKIVYLVIMQMILVLCTISPFNSFIYLKNQKGCLHFKAVVIAFRGK